MNIIVVGINPGSPMKKLKKNTTIDRLNSWMDFLQIPNWGFVNVISKPGDYSKLPHDTEFVLQTLKIVDSKILALGNFPSSFLKRNGVDHFTLPHPSPLNRKLNCKIFEKNVLIECRNYIAES